MLLFFTGMLKPWVQILVWGQVTSPRCVLEMGCHRHGHSRFKVRSKMGVWEIEAHRSGGHRD